MLEIDKDFGNEEQLDIILWRVYSKRKRDELKHILRSADPSHAKRLFFVGFLHSVGYSYEEILSIIHRHNCWGDYNRQVTAYQVSSVLNRSSDLNHEKSSFPSSSPKRTKSPNVSPVFHHIGYEKFLSLNAEKLRNLTEEQRVQEYHSFVARKYAKSEEIESVWGVRGI